MNIPPIVKGLLILNIIMFIVFGLLFDQYSSILGLYYYRMPMFKIWQPITYMFMHAGIMHLLFNMFALWMFGRIMEQVWGAQRFLIYYLVCGLGAAAVQEICQEFNVISSFSMTIGASGAVYGILLAFGMTFPDEKIFIIPIPFPIKAKYFIGFYIMLELLEGFGSKDSVAHFAHLGGMLFGAILILLWKKGAKRKRYSNNHGYWTSSSSNSYYDMGNEGITDKISNIFKGKDNSPKMTITYSDRGKDYEYNAKKKENNDEIDRILDKVRKTGYSSLTDEEKNTLFNASKN